MPCPMFLVTCSFTSLFPFNLAVVVTFLPSAVVSWNASLSLKVKVEDLKVEEVLMVMIPFPSCPVRCRFSAVGHSAQAI